MRDNGLSRNIIFHLWDTILCVRCRYLASKISLHHTTQQLHTVRWQNASQPQYHITCVSCLQRVDFVTKFRLAGVRRQNCELLGERTGKAGELPIMSIWYLHNNLYSCLTGSLREIKHSAGLAWNKEEAPHSFFSSIIFITKTRYDVRYRQLLRHCSFGHTVAALMTILVCRKRHLVIVIFLVNKRSILCQQLTYNNYSYMVYICTY